MPNNDEWWDNYLQEQRDNRKEEVRQKDEFERIEQEKNRQRQHLASSPDFSLRSTSGSYSNKGKELGIFGKLITCLVLVVGLIVVIYIFGWAIATFVVK